MISVPGYQRLPTNNQEIDPMTGLKRSMFLRWFKRWQEHPTLRLRTVRLQEEGANRGMTLYHRGDLQAILDDMADQQAREKKLEAKE